VVGKRRDTFRQARMAEGVLIGKTTPSPQNRKNLARATATARGFGKQNPLVYGSDILAGGLFSLNRVVDFLSMNGDFNRRVDPKSHLVSANFHDRDGDVVANDDFLVTLSRKDKHPVSSFVIPDRYNLRRATHSRSKGSFARKSKPRPPRLRLGNGMAGEVHKKGAN
jgi:hypothetical protein